MMDAANGYPTNAGGYLQPQQQTGGAPPPTQYPGVYPTQPQPPPQPQQQTYVPYGPGPAQTGLAGLYSQTSTLVRSNSSVP